MTPAQEQMLMLKGAISEFPPDLQQQCKELAELLRLNIQRAGEPVGTWALALVAAEYQIKWSKETP